MDKKTLCLKYVAYTVTGLLLTLFIMSWRGLPNANGVKEILKILSDSFTLPGGLFVGFAGLGWVSTKGGYDLFGYAFSTFRSYFVRDAYFKKQETYFDYVQRRNTERKPFNRVMFIVGIVFFLVGTIITIVYMSMK